MVEKAPPTEKQVTDAKTPAGTATPKSPPATEGGTSATDKRFSEWGSDLAKPAHMKQADVRGKSGDGGNPAGTQDAGKGGDTQQASGKITVKYRGADREYDTEAARNLIQQGLALQEKHTSLKPVIDGTETLMQRIGVSDPNVFMNTVMAGLQALSEKQAGSNTRNDKSSTAAGGDNRGDAGAAAAAGQQDIETALGDFEKQNGIVLTPAFRAMMTNLAKNSNQVAAVAGTLPTLQKQVEDLTKGARLGAMRAQADAVNSAADRRK